MEVIIGGSVVVLLAAGFAAKRWVTGDSIASEYPKQITEEGTAHVSHYFERKHATVTYPDGSEERVVYDERSDKENRIILRRFSEECFEVRSSWNNGRPTMSKQSVPEEDTRMFSLANVRGIDIDRTDEMVAGAEVEVEREKEERESGNKYTTYTRFDKHEDHEVGIWYKGEWKAHIDR